MSALNGSSLNGLSPLNGSAPMNGLTPLDGSAPLHDDTPAAGVPLLAPAPVVWPPNSFDDVDREKARLETELAAANARLAAVQQRAVVRDAEVRAVLQSELLASKETLARMEREYEMAIAMVRTAAETEAARVLSEARGEIARRSQPAPPTGAHDAE